MNTVYDQLETGKIDIEDITCSNQGGQGGDLGTLPSSGSIIEQKSFLKSLIEKS